MKRHWIEYRVDRLKSPMTFWVHRPINSKYWDKATEYNPPLEKPLPGLGYPKFNVEFNGFTFYFSSIPEIHECIKVLGRKLLPRSIDLSRERSEQIGPNSHWLSRLPAKVKSWKYRENAVRYLNIALVEFEKNLADS